jgi:tight adherence protein B
VGAVNGLFPDLVSWNGLASYAGLVLLFSAYFLVLEAIFLSFAHRTTTRSALSKRLSTQSEPSTQREVLTKIRQRRSLSADGRYTLPMIWLNRLIVQSGVTWGPNGLPLIFIGLSATLLAVALVETGSFPAALVVGLGGGAGILLLALAYLRGKRRKKFEGQLPEAVDILVRSVKAGHPVSAAIRLVARELPDPIGTEFGIAADELTYGLDLETAMNNMGSRVGQQDLTLVIVAIGIQARTGGNLAEILSSMSTVVRERLKMRLKAKALSAEGRFSAVILSILPFALFGLLWVIAPTFYGEIWGHPLVKPILFASVLWMILGNLVMFRMVKFEI